jgi:NTP pyrophosphatase (non-canonical NTP hydrolase)
VTTPPTPDSRLEALRLALDAFAHARDWRQFHSPRNLAACLSVEAGELLELYLWTRDGEGPHPPGAGPPDPARVREEVGDVLLSLLNFATVAGVDVLAAAEAKFAALERKYPVDLSRGSAVKSPGLAAPAAGPSTPTESTS